MNCTNCYQRIEPGQRYHRSKKGPHHWDCKKQQALRKKHGTPAEFAAAVYSAVPAFLSMDEAAEAVRKYNQEWNDASDYSRRKP